MWPYHPGDLYRSALGGTGRVADDLYLIAHHEVSGRPYLSSRATGIGLAGSLLGELLAAQRPAVTIDHGRVFPLYRKDGDLVARYARPDDLVSARVLDLVLAESSPRPVRDWLLFLGRTSAAEVAGRLERSGYLTRPASLVPWRTRRPVPLEGDWAQCALLRAHAALNAARALTPYPALLTGLTAACGLGFRYSHLSHLSNAPARSAEEAARVLPRPLRELIAHVRVTADAAVLSSRT